MALKEVVGHSDPQEEHEAMLWCSAPENIGRQRRWGGWSSVEGEEGTEESAWDVAGTSPGQGKKSYIWSRSDSCASLK